jgi:hypothetical protein
MGVKDQAGNDIPLALQTILREKQLAPANGLVIIGPSVLSSRKV